MPADQHDPNHGDEVGDCREQPDHPVVLYPEVVYDRRPLYMLLAVLSGALNTKLMLKESNARRGFLELNRYARLANEFDMGLRPTHRHEN